MNNTQKSDLLPRPAHRVGARGSARPTIPRWWAPAFVAVCVAAAVLLLAAPTRAIAIGSSPIAGTSSVEVGQPAAGGVGAQVAYALAHWSDRNVAQYGTLGNDDCVNFVSQTLVARGWPQTTQWWHTESFGVNHYSAAWISSTALAGYLTAHPELAQPLTDGQRSRVAVGDIVQFDWDNSGNRDHTGVVTRIRNSDGHVEIDYASHSHDRQYMSVDAAIALDGRGGTAYYWHLLK